MALAARLPVQALPGSVLLAVQPPLVDGADQVTVRGLTLLSRTVDDCGSVDAAILVHQGGFELKAAGAVNMFPQTSHVESIALIERDGRTWHEND